MKLGLTVRLGQQLRLTPQLQQAIRLLSMSSLELREELARLTEDNPLLTLEEEAGTPFAPIGTGASQPESDAPDQGREPSAADSDPAPSETDRDATDGGMEESRDSLLDWGRGSSQAFEGEDGEASVVGLREHLQQQLAGMVLSARDRAWVQILVESLDEDGFLADGLDELASVFEDLFVTHFGEALDPDEQTIGLKLLQSLDPCGVGARSLQECLGLQLRELPMSPTVLAAQKLVDEQLQSLGSLAPASLARLTGLSTEQVVQGLALIRRLNPRPAAQFQTDRPDLVIPEVAVHRNAQGVWVARLTPRGQPRLQVNEELASLMGSGESGGSLQQKLTEARRMVKNLSQRSDTILRVAQAIVAAQQAFFEHGPRAMRPMVLRDIAEVCELHESTVSRVTTQKYLLAPQGCLELKYFFSSKLRTEGGPEESGTAIRAQIQAWVDAEDGRSPLSDQAMADRFQQELGVSVARRTVAKYREALRIGSASQRRSRS